MKSDNLLDLSTLPTGQTDELGHTCYELGGQSWRLHKWDFLPGELRLRKDGRDYVINCALEGGKVRGAVEFATPEGMELKAVLAADDAQSLATQLLAHDWPVRAHRGINWYRGESKFGTTRWEAMLGPDDKGVMMECQEAPCNTWVVSRELRLSGATLNLHYTGQDQSLAPGGSDGRLFNFEEAANKCMALVQLASTHTDKNDDKVAKAYEAGRASVFDAIDALRRGPKTPDGAHYYGYGHTG